MRTPRFTSMLASVLALLPLLGGCQSHPLTDYRAATEAGIYYGTIEDLKKLNTSDAEESEVINLKRAGVSEETIVALVRIAHEHQHPFVNTDAVKNLSHANFSDARILQIAQTDKLDSIGGDALLLHVVGLSDSSVQMLLDRRLNGVPTMAVNTIAELKNAGLSEKEILYRVQNGMTDSQGLAEAAARQKAMARNTGFRSNSGRKPR
ncbi:MAG TPA: hypothetical protein VKT53_17245 [Candidatus Acidoferrum sp.]|nr:hypothetical protein [Candidatus Acidoferrum sp.]